MIRFTLQEEVGKYMTLSIGLETTNFLGGSDKNEFGKERIIVTRATIGILPSKELEKCNLKYLESRKASFGFKLCP
jgi:hypothetical protein